MTTTTKAAIAFGVVAGIFGIAAFFGVTPFLKVVTNVEQLAGTTVQGGTTATAHFYSVAANLNNPGANATSSSIFNSSSNDFYITSIKAGCEVLATSQTPYSGGGLAALTVFAATSSTPAPANNAFNVNKVGGGNLTIGTSTTIWAQSTSTISGANGVTVPYMVWPAQTYLTFTTNATNTAVCTFGVEAFSS